MKVSIGEYPTRLICNIHTRHMENKYGMLQDNVTHEDHVFEAIEDMLQDFYNVFNWLWFDRRQQKIKVKIDKWDTWSMDHTLASIVLPMLKQLKATKHGAPIVDDKDVPKELRSKNAPPKENMWDTDANHFLRWDWVLDEMIWAFEQKCRDDWDGDYYEYRDIEPEESKDPNSLFGLVLVWEDKKGRADHQKRMTKGFKLFGKYYENLWD
tara:strand:- start:1281 stop:1910 length:630 start_codon:yes stop_codon:yes gene_type:complete